MIDGLNEQEFKDYQVRIYLLSLLRKLNVVKKHAAFDSFKYLMASEFDIKTDHNGEIILVQKTRDPKIF